MTTTAAIRPSDGSTAVDRPGSQQQREVTRLLPGWLLVLIAVLLCAAVLLPIVYIGLASFNSDIGVASGEFWPSSWTISNYFTIWTSVGLANGLMNSLIVAGSTAVVSAAFSIGTAYVLVRYQFRGRRTILRALLGLQSIPGTLLVLPLFVLFSSSATYLGLQVIGTRWGLFVTYLTFSLPFSTWVMVTYLRGLPKELEEAARIDGATNLGVLTRIILPLSWPGLVVSAIFAFLPGWNDVLFASVMTRPDTQTAAVALEIFSSATEGGAIPQYGQMMAASLVSAAPVVLIYMFFQKYLVGGLTSGGVK
ncbi:Carbohydrate ABC transporter membrane protein 2, CUT1 family [Sinomonas atrocyanea]|uniref:Carbohydrate ABC transporter membrane protein 2, CUT1 family n=1 Tax=Sinomonas atrocyanea TaxID=37927 RepID=A0A126ZXI5_9MICC|nr:carbohydrate ABC transporter permease [Sinomonas atrocyanea]AMM31115.1 Carbohydrate ABC transporter membrane protein 2, CUT1 family [Sinomonas atrocyanea]GEB65863.1 ABC transporter permease [Sinomonas atrocyanea]GGG54683.1 ABC transporter permease [Sinomonas atrocyanea]